jgi:hypothetical protein
VATATTAAWAAWAAWTSSPTRSSRRGGPVRGRPFRVRRISIQAVLRPPLRAALRLQAAYYLVTGVWPFAHRRSFERLVGPKHDVFQLESTSALFLAVGAALAVAARSDRVPQAARALGVLAPLAAVGVELRHLPRIPKWFLLDTATQAAFGLAAATARNPR